MVGSIETKTGTCFGDEGDSNTSTVVAAGKPVELDRAGKACAQRKHTSPTQTALGNIVQSSTTWFVTVSTC